MKSFIILIGSGAVGILTGFGCALFLQALSQMSAEEDARHEYLSLDPWGLGDPHDVFTDDALTADKDCD